jgi:hypothetical protein
MSIAMKGVPGFNGQQAQRLIMEHYGVRGNAKQSGICDLGCLVLEYHT